MERGFFLVDDEARFLLVGLDVPIDIDHAGRGFENGLHLFSKFQAVRFIRPVNLSDERLQHRRSWWHFRNGHPCAVACRDGGDGRAHTFGDVMTLRLALMLADEVHLNVRDTGATAHEVVTHQAVEIVGRGDTGIDLVVGDFRLRADRRRHLPRHGSGLLQRSALRHVQDDLKLALVVKRQHLHLHPAEADRRHGPKQQHRDAHEEHPAPAGVMNQRAHHAAVQLGEEVLGVLRREMLVTVIHRDAFREFGILASPAQNANGGPRRDDERDEQRPEHRRARADRDRAHVGSHETTDKSHRQHGGDHGKGGEDGGVSHFAHGFDGDL